jgi:FkbM family methyltransferase
VGIGSTAKRAGESLWYRRGHIPGLNLPIPVRLPYGGWFLAHGDAMGARIAGYRLSRAGYEERQWRLVSRLLQPGSVFVDIGANQGFYSILGGRRVGESGRVFAFEPASSERQKLVRNLNLNRLANVVVEAQALGRREGTTEFHLCLDHQGSWSSIRPPADDVTARQVVVEVPITTLDGYLIRDHEVDHVNLIKIDVEGGELDVLVGGQEVLARFRPVVLCELEDRRTRQWGYGGAEIIGLLEKSGYRWFGVDQGGRLMPADATDQHSWQNLVAVPSEKATEDVFR